MIGKTVLGLAGACLLASSPVAAKDTAAAGKPTQEEEGLQAFAQMFKAEPLTADQSARLPAASATVEKILPPGAMDEVMGSMFDSILKPIFRMAGKPSKGSVAAMLGQEPAQLDLTAEQLEEASALLDPASERRNQRVREMLPKFMGRAMRAMEPGMKKAMSEFYAVNFDGGQLRELDSFFSTATGQAYARKSMRMSADPRFLGAMMSAMPQLMGSMAEMEGEMKASMADLPEPRTYADLNADERARLMELTGLSAAQLRAGLSRAAEKRAAK